MHSSIKNSAIISFVVIILTVLISSTDLLKSFNNNLYDLFLQMDSSTSPVKQVVIVEIDDKTIYELGNWPLNRSIYASFLDKVFKGGAKTAGFFIDFTIPTLPESDREFLRALNNYSVVALNPFAFKVSKPDNVFWKEIKKIIPLGHDIIQTDKDGVARNISPVLNNVPAFVLSLLSLYDPERFSDKPPYRLKGEIIGNTEYFKMAINYKTPIYLFDKVSLVDVIDDHYPPDLFRDKIVIAGVTKTGLVDKQTTPLSKKFHFSGTVPPLYLQAQVIDNLLNYPLVFKVDSLFIYILLLIYVPVLIIQSRHQDIVKQLMVVVILLSLVEMVLVFLVFKYFYYWIPFYILIIANILVFILILITANIKVSRFLDNYISELRSKTDPNTAVTLEKAVDDKLVTLKEVTELIEKDRYILDTVLNTIKNSVILFDIKGKIIYYNHPEEHLSLEALLKEISFDEILKELKDKEVYRKYFCLKNRQFEFIANSANEKLFTGVFNDITEITQINETKSIIVKMFSHEMKTPLTTILLSCDYLFSSNKDNSLNAYIEKIATQTEFLKEIITDFLELNKLEIPEFQLEIVTIDIYELLYSVKESLKVISSNKNICIEIEKPEDKTIKLEGDRKYLSILFKNIIDNALKYSSENTKIFIKTLVQDNNVVIFIEDQGFGMTEEEAKKLFNKFYRVKNEKTEAISGTGLGLSFVKKIVELHHGSIKVSSSPDMGSVFTVSLPVKPVDRL